MNGDEDPALYFELDGSVALTCPDCDETVCLDDDEETQTLGDILAAVREHKCEGTAAAAGKETADGNPGLLG